MVASQKLEGVFLPLATPFHQDMSVDYKALQSNMRVYAASRVKGFLALGSNGENRCLRESEKQKILEVILAYKAAGQVVMAGCIYDSTELSVEFIRFAAKAGADYATLLTPSYFRKQMTHEVLIDYFTACADAAEIPVLLYNAPGFTGVTLAPRTVAELARHPNIAGMKDSAPGGIENFIPLNSPNFCVMAGSANFMYPTLTQGLRGGIVSLGNAVPHKAYELWTFGRAGGSPEGQNLHERMKEANQRISGAYGVPGVKAAMDAAGLAGGWPRHPLRRLESADRKAVRQALMDAQLLDE
ncbi:MAG: dihydrodipicolinate synthase family protein [Candidatus Omnitrophica bacterium]|nr:dihydrodipicolinate synthase family protein [Candidatus Omnitrophota bacterium]